MKRPVEVIDISSDEEPEVIELDSESDTVLSDGRQEAVQETNSAAEREIVPEQQSASSDQQRMRALLAGAAEKRIKRQRLAELNPTEVKPVKLAQEMSKASVSTLSPIHLISCEGYCTKFCPTGNTDTVSMVDMIGSPLLAKTWQFNFLIDTNFLVEYLRADPVNVEIICVCNEDEEHFSVDKEHQFKWNIKHIDTKKRLLQYGSHHTKMMVNFFQDDTCQVVVHTMNLTLTDYELQTQMCWLSPRLKRCSNTKDYLKEGLDPVKDNGLIFKYDLIHYLKSYDEDRLQELIDEVSKYDFSPVDVQLVTSSPGTYSFDEKQAPNYKDNLFGYGKLRQWLQIHHLTSHSGQLIAQTSSIAAPLYKSRSDRGSNILSHLFTSIAEGSTDIKSSDHDFTHGIKPVIIWPTVPEVVNARGSILSGYALHFNILASGNYTAYEDQWRSIRKFFYRWDSIGDSKKSRAGRSRLSPHVKTYCVTKDNFKTLDWFLLTSANISTQAWGAPLARSKEPVTMAKYKVSSYEAGILINPLITGGSFKKPLVPVYGKDSLSGSGLPVRLPYDTPLKHYTPEDVPWTTRALTDLQALISNNDT